MKLKPYEQGALDSLCGIYSIVNAMRVIRGLSNEESQELFTQIIGYLEDNKSLAVTLAQGISITVMGSIFKDVIGEKIDRAIPFQKQTDVRISEFWTEMTRFLHMKRLKGEKRVILLSLGGLHDHWTIVRKISSKRIWLFDSIGLQNLDRSKCTTRKASSSRRHLIYPTQTYFLKQNQNVS
jgi:hypothetical protein